MLARRLCALSFALLLGTSAARAATATFNCHKPRGTVAETICGAPEYVAMDREIAALTDLARARLSLGEQSQLVASTARFLRQRSGCAWAAHNSAHPGSAVDECVRASMETRARRLRDVVERGEVTAR